jgi:hypothetical protein
MIHAETSPSRNKRANVLLRFILHFAEMWVAMLIGDMAFGYVRHWLAIVGVRSFLDPVSIWSEVGHGIFMTAPMVLWMRIRGNRWRENVEMALGMIVPWATVLTLRRFGVLPGLPCYRNEAQWLLECWRSWFITPGTVASRRFRVEDGQIRSNPRLAFCSDAH